METIHKLEEFKRSVFPTTWILLFYGLEKKGVAHRRTVEKAGQNTCSI